MADSPAVILGIESSCDETALALLRGGRQILGNFVATQVDLHRKFGGVVPEVACRAHMEVLLPGLQTVLTEADLTPPDIDAIAVTNGPGLIGALLVGVTAAKALALAWDKPLIGVNHIEAHISACRLHEPNLTTPCVALVASGGHTSLYALTDWDTYAPISTTRDDAAGEAFDKVAKILELGFPGGPAVEKSAKTGNPNAFNWRKTCLPKDDESFSFSGIKTAVLYAARGNHDGGRGALKLAAQGIADAAASFQDAVANALVTRTLAAAKKHDVKWIALGGGVAANNVIRTMLTDAAAAAGCQLVVPPHALCTDNAVMIAARGFDHYERGEFAPLELDAYARG